MVLKATWQVAETFLKSPTFPVWAQQHLSLKLFISFLAVFSCGLFCQTLFYLQDLAVLLNFDPTKFLNLLLLVRNYSTVFKQARVQFDLDVGLDTSHFLSCFKVAVTRTARRNLSETLRETVARELTEPAAKDKDEETEVDVKKEKGLEKCLGVIVAKYHHFCLVPKYLICYLFSYF